MKDPTKGVLLVAFAVLLALSQFWPINNSTSTETGSGSGSGSSGTSVAQLIANTLPILLIVASIHWVALQLFIFN